jgi:hypothetical protein
MPQPPRSRALLCWRCTLANKNAAALLLLLLVPLLARAELLKLSLLQKPAPAFSLKRDMFNGGMPAGNDARAGRPQEPQQVQAAAAQRSIAEEIFQSISYEGYVVKNGKKSALLNVSGEFFMVGEGEQVLQKIRILAISRDTVTIEYESQPYDIKLKGDENG